MQLNTAFDKHLNKAILLHCVSELKQLKQQKDLSKALNN